MDIHRAGRRALRPRRRPPIRLVRDQHRRSTRSSSASGSSARRSCSRGAPRSRSSTSRRPSRSRSWRSSPCCPSTRSTSSSRGRPGAQDRLEKVTGILPTTCGTEDGAVGTVTHCRELAIANMTGANRLLIGIGWSVVVLLWWKRSGEREVRLGERRRIELGFLFLATLWAFTIVIRGHISMLDMVVLLVRLRRLHLARRARGGGASGAGRPSGRRRRAAEGSAGVS